MRARQEPRTDGEIGAQMLTAYLVAGVVVLIWALVPVLRVAFRRKNERRHDRFDN